MSQHDYVIANGTGAAVRSDLNGALAAIVSNNSGATAPSTTYAYQWWADTTTGLLKLRNAANNAWITLFQLDGEWSTLAVENGSASAPSIYFKDSGTDTGIYSPGADQVAISTNGSGRLFVDSSGRVGVGTASPSNRLHVSESSSSSTYSLFENTNTSGTTLGAGQIVKVGTTEIGYIRGTGSTWSYGTAAANQFQVMGVAGGGLNLASASAPITFSTGNADVNFSSERVRITAAGLVGIGTTPSYKFHVSDSATNVALIQSSNSGSYIAFQDSATSTATSVGIGSTGNSLAFYANSSERGRFDASGRLLVGTSTARSNIFNTSSVASNIFQVEKAQDSAGISIVTNNDTSGTAYLALCRSKGTSIGSNTLVASGDVLGTLTFQGSDGTEFVDGARIEAYVDGTSGANDLPTRLVFSTTRDGQSSPTQALVIKESQEALFTTSTSAASATGWYGVQANAQVGAVSISRNGSNVMAFFHTSNANGLAGVPVGTISITTTATSYNTSSDYRLKENVEPVTDGITRLQQLKPSRFNFIADPDKTVDGFLAHEVAEVVPECVTGEKNAVDEDGNPVYQGIDQSKLVPLLTAALQEAIGEIESLKARVAALEAA